MRFDINAMMRLWSDPLPDSDQEAVAAFRELYTDPVVVNGAELTAADLTEDDRRRLNGGVLQVLQKSGLTRDQLLGELRELVAQSLPDHVQLESAGDA